MLGKVHQVLVGSQKTLGGIAAHIAARLDKRGKLSRIEMVSRGVSQKETVHLELSYTRSVVK